MLYNNWNENVIREIQRQNEQAEERIIKLEDKTMEILDSEEQKDEWLKSVLFLTEKPDCPWLVPF